jgi:hypothetical protein
MALLASVIVYPLVTAVRDAPCLYINAECERKRAAFIGCALHRDAAPIALNNFLTNIQSEPYAAGVHRRCGGKLSEQLEELFLICLRDADACIGN